MHGSIYFTLGFANGICLGLIRAIAGLCLGVICHAVCCWLKEQRFKNNILITLLFTSSELFCFFCSLWIAKYYPSTRVTFVGILFLACGVICSFSGYSICNKIADKLPTAWIGKFSISLYLNHYVWVRVLCDWKIPVPYKMQTVVFVILSMLSTVICILMLDIFTFVWGCAHKGINKPDGVEI